MVATNGFDLQASATLDFTGAEPTPTSEPTATTVAAAAEAQNSDEAPGTIPPAK
ncbi:MAG: hypothetical protein R2932_34365 [Caldilineaceae bacterium]